MHYRKIYEQTLQIKLENGYEIHHIDFNHNNDNFENLVALPKGLHRALHESYNEFNLFRHNYTLDDIVIHAGQLNGSTVFIDSVQQYIMVVQECTKYMNLKYKRLEILNNGQ